MAAALKRPLPGYEQDINNLIDAYSILAHHEQVLSFQTFKQLFKSGCFAYIHQAYWGCEHSPEYAQLLFAVALDRLDIPSPTAPADSWLWQLYQLIPCGVPAAPPTAGEGQSDMQLQQQQQHSEPMETDELFLLQAGSSLHMPPAQPAAAAAAAAEPAAMHVDQLVTQDAALLQQWQQPLQPVTLEGHGQHEGVPPALVQAQQHQQQQHLEQHSPAGQRLPTLLQQQQQHTLQAHQQQQQPLEQASDDWMTSPLVLPQGPPQQGQPVPGLSPSDAVWQLMTPLMSPLQSHDTGAGAQSGLEGLDGFLLPAAAIPPVSQAQQQQLQQQQQQQLQQAPGGQQQRLQRDAVSAGALHQQGEQQQQEEVPAQPLDDEDDFLSDLLAILDEATQGQQHTGQQHTAGLPDAADPACPQSPAAAGTAGSATQQQQQQQQQQQFLLQIPLVVKGAAVFMLLALHESQLNYPKVPVYVPLPLLQHLATAAVEFSTAGAAAADALHAVRMLVQQQRLLVGQFRRPSHWEPQLPAHMMPGGRLPGGLGLDTAIGTAARKAARKAAKSGVQSAAVAAAGRTARAFDPGVHREAVFHIKSALRGLSNFKSLQSLCDEYAGARQAVFEPLLGSSQPQTTAAAARLQQQQQQQTQQTQPAAAGASGGAGEQGGALVVKRGGSRRKRAAAAGAAAAAGQPVAAEDQPAAQVLGAGQQQQPVAAAAGGSLAPQAPDMALPELFDTGFASVLQGLANSEASRMLLLLDPYYNANKVRKRVADERRAAKAAEAAAAAEAQGRLDRFKRLTMGRAAGGSQQQQDQGGSLAAGRHSRQQQHRPSRSAPAAPAAAAGPLALDMRQELLAAGVLTEQDLEDGADLGPGMDTALSGVAQQVLRHAAQQRQAAVQVAEEWLRAQSALVVVEADEDMP